MSIVAQGMSRLNCVWRCTKGFCSAFKPAIHILAGLKVCIQVIKPTQSGATFALVQSSYIESGVVNVGLNTTLTGICLDCDKASAIFLESSATCLRVLGPYKC